MTTTSDILRAAAVHISQVGLYQDGSFFENQPPESQVIDHDAPCCTFGAIAVVAGWAEALYGIANREIEERVFARTQRSVILWSDSPGTALTDVVSLLTSTADELDNNSVTIPEEN